MLFLTLISKGQSKNDSVVRLKPSTARALFIAAEQKEVLEAEVANLNDRILGLQHQIDLIEDNDSVARASYEREILILKDQKNIALSEIKALQKQLKRARRAQRWTAIAGIVTTAAAIIFIK